MMLWGTGTHFCHIHICSRMLNMTSMRSYSIFIGFKYTKSSVFCIVTSIFGVFEMTITLCWQGQMHYFGRLQHSQPHIIMYQSFIVLSWGCNMLRNVESLMIILSSTSLEYFSPPSTGVLSILLFISLTDTSNNNFGTSCGASQTSVDNLRQ